MSTPDFTRAQYADTLSQNMPMPGGPTAAQIAAAEAFPMALALGTLAAILCTVVYAFVSSFGVMFGILVVGFAWLIAKAMLSASNGYGGKLYRIAAVTLVYFTVNCGKLLLPVVSGYQRSTPIPVPTVLAYLFFGPILRLQTGLYGILSLLVLGYGIRMAWRMGKGTRAA